MSISALTKDSKELFPQLIQIMDEENSEDFPEYQDSAGKEIVSFWEFRHLKEEKHNWVTWYCSRKYEYTTWIKGCQGGDGYWNLSESYTLEDLLQLYF